MNYSDIKKQIRLINTFLTEWLHTHGFKDCVAYFDTEFTYDFANDIITYSFNYHPEDDDLYLEVCKKCRPEIIDCDNFIVSFFHELGHYTASNSLTDEEWQNYVDTISNVERLEDPTDEEMLNYYLSDLEYDATKWGCDYIVQHEQDIQSMLSALKKISPSYYEWKDLIVNTK